MKKRLTAAILLSAFLGVVFAPIFLAAGLSGRAPDGMIYCPLSKRFQPVNPPAENRQPFSNICASGETKDFLFREIFVRNLSKRISLRASSLDKLAFDFLSRGEKALKILPGLPDSPSENLAKRINSNAAYVNYEYKFVCRQPVKILLPETAPRPPPVQQKSFFAVRTVSQTDELAHSIVPRAPPFLS